MWLHSLPFEVVSVLLSKALILSLMHVDVERTEALSLSGKKKHFLDLENSVLILSGFSFFFLWLPFQILPHCTGKEWKRILELCRHIIRQNILEVIYAMFFIAINYLYKTQGCEGILSDVVILLWRGFSLLPIRAMELLRERKKGDKM